MTKNKINKLTKNSQKLDKEIQKLSKTIAKRQAELNKLNEDLALLTHFKQQVSLIQKFSIF
jgi:prefoldin subunit 5